jgi:hypothetical protein
MPTDSLANDLLSMNQVTAVEKCIGVMLYRIRL